MIEPTYDRMVVKTDDALRTTAAGIVLPESADEKAVITGQVLAVGQGRIMPDGSLAPLQCRTGDQVHFRKGLGIPLHDEEHGIVLVLKEGDALGISPRRQGT
jgi:chaperonin GroES